MSKFSGADWEKHNYKYVIGVLNDILAGKDILLGNTKNPNNYISADAFDKNKVADLLHKIESRQTTVYTNLNSCLIGDPKELVGGKNVWSNIFKGPYSNYENGTQDNQGNKFESEFVSNFDDYYKQVLLDYASSINDKDLYNFVSGCTKEDASTTGSENNKRPIACDNNIFYLQNLKGSGDNIGATISDVTVLKPVHHIPLTSMDVLYLSLKYESTYTLINTGLTRLFPASVFNNALKWGTTANSGMPKIGEDFLNMFGIDSNRFISTFTNYVNVGRKNQTSGYTEVNVNNIADLDAVGQFVKSAIGVGYMIIHKFKKGNIEIHDFREGHEDNIYKFLGCDSTFIPDNIIVQYPSDNTKKRVQVLLSYKNRNLLFVFRNKSGGVNPTFLMLEVKNKTGMRTLN